MMNVTRLAQHILTLEPASNAPRLCFYHFLKNLCDANQAVTSELLNQFFARALCFPYWQEHKQSLFQEAATCLKTYQAKNPAEAEATMADLSRAWGPDDLQIVPIESQSGLIALLNRTLSSDKSAGDQFRVFPEGPDRAIVIRMTANRQITATVYPPVAKLIDGEISPLCTDFTLTYGADLLLTTDTLQQIDVGSHTSARFRFGSDGCQGILTRGYTFQKYAVMEGGSLHRYPILFYPLKRLEQYFVNRKTDPMYIELTGILEKAVDLLGQDHPEAIKFGKQALERGKLALEHIFPDDKLMRLLITNLEKTLALEAVQLAAADQEQTAAPLEVEANWNPPMAPSAEWAPGASVGAWKAGQNVGRAFPLQQQGAVGSEFDLLQDETEKVRR